MKYKKIVSAMLCLAALAAVPAIPAVRNSLPDMSITADAATMPTNYYKYTTGGITYELDTKNKEAHVYSYTGSPSTVNIPATVNYVGVNYPIVSIRSNAFKNCSTLYKLNLASATNMRSIGAEAFAGSSVQYVDLKGTNLTVGEGAFRNTQKLINVYVYSAVNSLTIEKEAFTGSSINTFYCYAKNLTLKSDCFVRGGRNLNFYIYSYTDTATIQTCAFGASSLSNLEIYCRNITIAQNAFWGKGTRMDSSSLSSVFFGSNTKIITLYDGAFRGLASLQSVTFNNPSADVFMGKYMFSGSTLKTITLPASLTKIPDYCFENCQSLVSYPMTGNVTAIGRNAFSNATLPATVSLSKKVTSIDNTAFANVKGVKAFSVASDNPNYKADNGVLFSKNGSTLLCYPPLKTGSNYSTSASVIPNGAFSYNKYLKTLSITKLSRSYSDTVEFPGLENLETLTIPTADYNNQSGSYILRRYYSLFYATNLHKLNGKELVETPSGKEPQIVSKYRTYIMDNLCENIEYLGFVKDYLKKMDAYVVNKVTNSSMTDMEKALRLQDWIMNRAEYDPNEAEWCNQKWAGQTPDPNLQSDGNHCDSSVYMHYVYNSTDKKYHYYTVCDGYARCYRRLLQQAGIAAFYVNAENTTTGDWELGHAWNLVKINGNYFHVDVCWNDGTTGTERYKHFMRSDEVFARTHKDYLRWNIKSLPGDEKFGDTSDLHSDNNVASFDVGDLGRVKPKTSIDSYAVKRLEAIVAGSTPNAYERFAGDIDFNGVLDSRDVTLLKQYLSTYSRSYTSVSAWRFDVMTK